MATQIGTNQIKDGAITEPKLSADALRPISAGSFSGTELTFDEVRKKYTSFTLNSDKALTLAASGNVANSTIEMTVTGDGSHLMTFPATWNVEGTFSEDHAQLITFYYDGTLVWVTIKRGQEVIVSTLTTAVITESVPNVINLTFSAAVSINQIGWSVATSGDAVTILGVTGSDTAIPVFALSRDITAGETVTISYDPNTGNTTSLSGSEIATITAFPVDSPDIVSPQVFDIYVDASAADDTAAGTIGDPFKTIGAAMAAAVAGDVIAVRAGTYREATIVCKANVTVKEYPGETAIISGFEVVGTSGWTVHSGNIYKKTITLPVNGFNTSTSRVQAADPHYVGTTIMANQILRNGVMMHEARWPNIAAGTADLFDRTKYRNGINSGNGFNTTSLTDATLPVAANGLVGATLVSNGWFSQDPRTITGHSGNVISWASPIWDNTPTGVWFRWRYYLTGKLALLDAEAEWHYESGTLYFWQPGGGTPTGTIEYKARNYAFDARGKANVSIIGLTFIGCDPFMGDTGSTGAVIDNIDVTFQNHYVRHDVVEWQGVGMCKQFGIKLLGANSVIKNSRIAYCAGTAVWIGEGCRAENNLIHDVGYAGYWGNGISLWGTTSNQVITRNTIYRTGRSAFDFGYNFGYAQGATTNPTSYHYNVEVSYNDFSYSCLISSDGGATYTWGQCDLFGLNYHHNWIHDIQARQQPDGGINVGIYFDQATGPGKIHHNVTWNCVDGDLYHETYNDWRPTRSGQPPYLHPDSRLDIYNNTFWNPSGTSGGGLYYSPASYRTYKSDVLDIQRNNIYRIAQVVNWIPGYNGNTSNSILVGTNPLFVADNIATPQTYFQLQSGSPARNIGLTSYAGVTGQITGAIDAGAYLYNNIDDVWIPGYTTPVDEVEGEFQIDDSSSLNTYTGAWSFYNNLAWNNNHINKTFAVTYDTTATLTVAFVGNHVEWWTEKRENHGIVEVRIDGIRQDCDTGTGGTQDCDLYANTTANGSQKVFEKDVTQGSHTISIHATNTHNASAVGTITQIVHDAFKFETA